ncbi:MAG TPA: sigma-70 family RNA polymerase sigma factor [Ardenticatenaceae bacterium]|nr:sigma-70 family RNA polymerase sigma factor [Ardenticatenaceae bacterium]
MTWKADALLDLTHAERERLVRLCARLTGAPEVAEDLAHETLLEAWRHMHKLYDPAGRERWLATIARNVCLRWRRRHWRWASRLAPLEADEEPAAAPDLETGVERRELAALLDRALARVPAATRRILVERYLYDLPHRAIAERLAMSEDAVAMRLSRGRQLLRRVLATDLREATRPYTALGTGAPWEPTRLWCQLCGRHRMLAQLPHTAGTVAFRCPGCKPGSAVPASAYSLANSHFAQLLGGLRQPKAIQARAANWAHTYFRDALAGRAARCTHCNRPAALHLAPPGDLPTPEDHPKFLYVLCDVCGTAVSTSFLGVVTNLPEVQAFSDAQARIRTLPGAAIEVAGQPAVVTRFESLTSAVRLDVIAPPDPGLLFTTYQVAQTARR